MLGLISYSSNSGGIISNSKSFKLSIRFSLIVLTLILLFDKLSIYLLYTLLDLILLLCNTLSIFILSINFDALPTWSLSKWVIIK